MKYLFLLLPFTLSAQIERTDSLYYSLLWKQLEYTDNTVCLTFNSPEGQVSFYRGAIVTDSDTLYCDKNIFRVIDSTLKAINKDKVDRINELETKILFYETYFGELKLDESEKCYIFSPVTNPPKMNNCKK